MRNRAALLISLAAAFAPGCTTRDDLPGPPVNTLQHMADWHAGRTSRSRMVVELYLTPADRSFTFWNDPENARDPWGTLELKRVDPDGTVVINFGDDELRARPGAAFPGTGVKVIASNPELSTALLRTRWIHTQVGARPDPVDSLPTETKQIPNFPCPKRRPSLPY